MVTVVTYSLLLVAVASVSTALATTSDTTSSGLQWYNITNAIDRGALCNDFSIAGYFVRKSNTTVNTTSTDTTSRWIIYLESGGGCSDPKSCNEHFIRETIRDEYSSTVNRSLHVDVEKAWEEYKEQPLDVTSRLMTSLWRVSGPFRSQDGSWAVQGRSILSSDPKENPHFYDNHHVLVPYCSSDLWIKNTRNYIMAMNNSFQFQFDPTSTEQQFTFRGVAILQSVIKDLFEFHGLRDATEVIFVGSSAGGIGVMHHTKWLLQQLQTKAKPYTRLYSLMDSAWFINFKGIIDSQFMTDDIEELSRTGEVSQTCTTAVGEYSEASRCITASSFLSHTNVYPHDVPTLVLFSRYDLYLLASAISQSEIDVIEIMRTVSEYSGSMDTSLQSTERVFSNLSSIATSCFQHVYLATSTLWGEPWLLGDGAFDGAQHNNRFRHAVSSDAWSTFCLKYLNSSSSTTESISLSDALHQWIQAAKNGATIHLQDDCSGPHCNSMCPETIVLGETTSYWSVPAQSVVLGLVLLVTVLSVTVKIVLTGYGKFILYNQRKYLEWHKHYSCMESTLPYCDDSEAISVACLNLRYSVKVDKSALKRASSPAQRKRLLSIAAAISNDVNDDGGKSTRGAWKGGEDEYLEGRDSITGQRVQSDFVQGIYQFQAMHQDQHNKQHKKKKSSHEQESSKRKEIIKGISIYFNPGELVAIMGPSGCGKTTFLDLLAGRRNDKYQGEIYVNGVPMDKMREWYAANTGYVLQLASPYYEELTVRENLTLAAQMRLPGNMSLSHKLERVEQVMNETGLTPMASTRVGGAVGPGGLSGGQKRRLCVALQLLSMPSLIFLDEPTSGLDSSASLELLNHLHRVASSNRAVILTIHQPRLEIFHMFDKIILLCQGQVAYHGIPDKAYEVFVASQNHSSLSTKVTALESKNPADVIMDMLGSEQEQMAILDYYQKSDEPQAVENAIDNSRASISCESGPQAGQRKCQKASVLCRLVALEARATKRAKLGLQLYLPVIFITYGILLGTVYLQTESGVFILSGFGVFSCASALFMFPIIYTYLYRAIEIFSLEFADGVGSPIELVLQTFIRFSTLAIVPILICSLALYLLVIPYTQYDLWVFIQVVFINLALNHTWIALLVFVILAQPNFSHRISPVLSAIAGFSGGFFVPPRLMPPWYSWLFYINPNYYAFSAMGRILLQSIELECQYESVIECYPSSGAYILTYFGLPNTNPYLHVAILLGMTCGFLLLAWTALTLRHSYLIPRVKKLLQRGCAHNIVGNDSSLTKTGVTLTSPLSDDNHSIVFEDDPLGLSLPEELGHKLSHTSFHSEELSSNSTSNMFRKVTVSPQISNPLCDSKQATLPPDTPGTTQGGVGGGGSPDPNRRVRYRKRQTLSFMLHDGESHEVWKPGKRQTKKRVHDIHSEDVLNERKRSIMHRINTLHVPRNDDSGGAAAGKRKGKGESPSQFEIMQRRMKQWKKIEDEALKSPDTVAGDTGDSSAASSPVAYCQHVSSFPLPNTQQTSVPKALSDLSLNSYNFQTAKGTNRVRSKVVPRSTLGLSLQSLSQYDNSFSSNFQHEAQDIYSPSEYSPSIPSPGPSGSSTSIVGNNFSNMKYSSTLPSHPLSTSSNSYQSSTSHHPPTPVVPMSLTPFPTNATPSSQFFVFPNVPNNNNCYNNTPPPSIQLHTSSSQQYFIPESDMSDSTSEPSSNTLMAFPKRERKKSEYSYSLAPDMDPILEEEGDLSSSSCVTDNMEEEDPSSSDLPSSLKADPKLPRLLPCSVSVTYTVDRDDSTLMRSSTGMYFPSINTHEHHSGETGVNITMPCTSNSHEVLPGTTINTTTVLPSEVYTKDPTGSVSKHTQLIMNNHFNRSLTPETTMDSGQDIHNLNKDMYSDSAAMNSHTIVKSANDLTLLVKCEKNDDPSPDHVERKEESIPMTKTEYSSVIKHSSPSKPSTPKGPAHTPPGPLSTYTPKQKPPLTPSRSPSGNILGLQHDTTFLPLLASSSDNIAQPRPVVLCIANPHLTSSTESVLLKEYTCQAPSLASDTPSGTLGCHRPEGTGHVTIVSSNSERKNKTPPTVYTQTDL